MRTGKLDRQVTILRAVTAPNAFNELEETWEPFATVWAQQRPNRGTERFSAAEVAGSSVMTIHTHYLAGVTQKDRVEHEGRVWNITDVRELGRRRVTEIDMVARGD